MIAGGLEITTFSGLATADIYNPATHTWKSTHNMHAARGVQTAALLPDGKVLVAGGGDGGVPFTTAVFGLCSAEIYDPARNRWTYTANLRTARAAQAGTVLADGSVLVAGGVAADGQEILNSAERYAPESGTWGAAGSMRNPAELALATLLPDGRVLVSGGVFSSVNPDGSENVEALSSAELFHY